MLRAELRAMPTARVAPAAKLRAEFRANYRL